MSGKKPISFSSSARHSQKTTPKQIKKVSRVSKTSSLKKTHHFSPKEVARKLKQVKRQLFQGDFTKDLDVDRKAKLDAVKALR